MNDELHRPERVLSPLASAVVLALGFWTSLFVGIVTTPRSALSATGPFVIASLITFLGLFVIVAAFSRIVLHHASGATAVQAACSI